MCVDVALMVARVKPILRLAPNRADTDIQYYEPCDKINEIMREQLEETLDRMADAAHSHHCVCQLCHKYELLVNMLLLPVFG